MTTKDASTIVDLYLRLSDLRVEDLNAAGEAKGLVEHERVLRERAEGYRWRVGEVIVENDVSGGRPKPASAFKRRKVVLPDGSTGWRVLRPDSAGCWTGCAPARRRRCWRSIWIGRCVILGIWKI